jgi:hypothetical protein
LHSVFVSKKTLSEIPFEVCTHKALSNANMLPAKRFFKQLVFIFTHQMSTVLIKRDENSAWHQVINLLLSGFTTQI